MYLKQIPVHAGFIYIACQIGGGIFAGGSVYNQLAHSSNAVAINDSLYGGNDINVSLTDNKKRYFFFLEMVGTMVLVFTLVKVIMEKKKAKSTPETYAVVYGFITIVNSISFGQITGAACNPARLLAPLLIMTKTDSKIFVMILGQVCGAYMGVIVWNELFNKESAKKGISIGSLFQKADPQIESEGLMMTEKKEKHSLDEGMEMSSSKKLIPEE